MNHDKNNDDPICRIEISIKNSQNDIRKLFLHSAKQEAAIEELQTVVAGIAEATASGFTENKERFDRQDKEFSEFKQETRERFERQDKEFSEFKQETREHFERQDKEFSEFKQETRERFERQDKEFSEFKQETRGRFDQLEMLIRQLLPNANN